MLVAPGLLMLGTVLGLSGIEQWTASFGTTPDARVMFGRIGIALPYVVAAAIGITFLFGARGAVSIRTMGAGVLIGTAAVVVAAAVRESMRLSSFADSVPAGASLMSYVDPATSIGATLAAVAGVFALRVAMRGDAAFASAAPRRIHGKRSIHGDAEWMALKDAKRLFPEAGGIVVGEAYRVDKDTVAERGFRADDRETWGVGGKSPLLCFDASFGSTHGLVFAGSGGFKTTSVTVPTALKWGGSLVALDPSNEVAPMVIEHRRKAGRDFFILDPREPSTGFNVLDWIGRFGGTKEEDLVAVANWVVTDTGRQASIRDDFFRASALQLITALIADVCLSGHTKRKTSICGRCGRTCRSRSRNCANGCSSSTTIPDRSSSRKTSPRSSP